MKVSQVVQALLTKPQNDDIEFVIFDREGNPVTTLLPYNIDGYFVFNNHDENQVIVPKVTLGLFDTRVG